MDEDTLNAAMRILNMAKVLESHGKLNRLMDMLGDCTEITWDNQCMVERFACESVFQNTKCYEQCGKQVSHHEYEPDREVYVLRDPLLDRFHALCREYESRRGITRIENPYARELEDAVHSAMRLSNYNFDYLWVDGSEARKSPKLLLFLFEEFYSFDEIPKALCDILDACQSGIRELEQELKKPAGKVIALPSQPALKQKEAA